MNVLPCGRRVFRLVGALACAFISAATAPAAPPASKTTATAAADACLAAMNANFRAAYKRARAETLAQAGPVILAHHEDLTLIQGTRREPVTVDLSRYHRLKAVAHVPLALYTMLAPWEDGPIPEDRLAPLREERKAIVATQGELDHCGFTPDQLARQRKILSRCVAFLDPILASRQFHHGALDAFARAAAPLVLANATDAAGVQIEASHKQISAWRRALGPDAWQQVRVIVIGRQLPRKDNILTQYFARLLDLPGECPRLVYAEELSGDDAALDLLGSHLLDRSVGRAFFNDPERMERDLLCDGARAYLEWRDLGR